MRWTEATERRMRWRASQARVESWWEGGLTALAMIVLIGALWGLLSACLPTW